MSSLVSLLIFSRRSMLWGHPGINLRSNDYNNHSVFYYQLFYNLWSLLIYKWQNHHILHNKFSFYHDCKFDFHHILYTLFLSVCAHIGCLHTSNIEILLYHAHISDFLHNLYKGLFSFHAHISDFHRNLYNRFFFFHVHTSQHHRTHYTCLFSFHDHTKNYHHNLYTCFFIFSMLKYSTTTTINTSIFLLTTLANSTSAISTLVFPFVMLTYLTSSTFFTSGFLLYHAHIYLYHHNLYNDIAFYSTMLTL